jgi:PhnB protein
MELNPYLTFDGRCEEAFRFYAGCLGGEIVAMLTHEGSPMASRMAPDWLGKIMHARLKIGDKLLMGSDAPPEHFSKTAGMSVTITVGDPAEAERIFTGLSEGGTVRMPLQQTFWAARFGMLTDRFGIPWMINAEAAPPS